MVVDHADSLHKGVADGRTDKAESASLKILAHGVGFARSCRHFLVLGPVVPFRLSADKLPNIGVEAAAFSLHGQEGACVGDGGFNLEAVAYDARVFQERADFFRVIARDALRIKMIEDFTVAGSFAQDG